MKKCWCLFLHLLVPERMIVYHGYWVPKKHLFVNLGEIN